MNSSSNKTRSLFLNPIYILELTPASFALFDSSCSGNIPIPPPIIAIFL